MNFTLLLVVTFLCLPEVTQAFVRKPRAFKSYNFERLPYKRSRVAYEDEAIGASAENRRQLHSWNQGSVDVTVGEMAELMTNNPDMALVFVMTFMDADGDGVISGRELLRLSKRR